MPFYGWGNSASVLQLRFHGTVHAILNWCGNKKTNAQTEQNQFSSCVRRWDEKFAEKMEAEAVAEPSTTGVDGKQS